MQLGIWSCAPRQRAVSLQQGPPLSSSLYQGPDIWTEMGLTRYSHRQMTDSWTKHLGTPKRQSQQCNNWITYPDPSGIKTPDLSSTQTRHKHYGVLGTVEQQAKRCWPAVTFDGACRRTEKSSEIPWDPLR